MPEYHVTSAATAARITPRVFLKASVTYRDDDWEQTETLLLRAEWATETDLAPPRIFLLDPTDVHHGRPPGEVVPSRRYADEPSLDQARQTARERLAAKRRLSQWVNEPLGLTSEPGCPRERFEQLCQRQVARLLDDALTGLDEQETEAVLRLRDQLAAEAREADDTLDEELARARPGLLGTGAALTGFLLGGRSDEGRRLRRGLGDLARRRRLDEEARRRVADEKDDVDDVAEALARLDDAGDRAEADLVARHLALLAETREIALAPAEIQFPETGVLWLPVTG